MLCYKLVSNLVHVAIIFFKYLKQILARGNSRKGYLNETLHKASGVISKEFLFPNGKITGSVITDKGLKATPSTHWLCDWRKLSSIMSFVLLAC